MTGQDEDQTDEFDVAARWTAESVGRLGSDHAIPAACRGSGGPGALAWLAQWLLAGSGTALLDVGGGVGGPAAWAMEHHGARPVLAEPMVGAVQSARHLFDLPSVVSTGERLPLVGGSFPAAWSLGVLDTTPDKAGLLAELRRVLVPGGRAGLVAYVATGPVRDAPEGNEFPTEAELLGLLDGAGLTVVELVAVADLPDDPPEWKRRDQRVQDDIEAHHGDDERWKRARADEDKVAELLSDGRVTGQALRLEAAPRS
jgi:SAM-dependent methyltransferase